MGGNVLTRLPKSRLLFGLLPADLGWWSAGVIAGLIVLWLALSCGSLGCSDVFSLPPDIRGMRVDRVLAAFCVGGLLSLAGGLLQLLLRNPLADPYVLGVSGGAAAGALSFSLLLPASAVIYSLQSGALLGALLATALLLVLARRSFVNEIALDSGTGGIRLILTGVMISAGFGALIILLLSLSPDAQMRGTLFWLMGELDSADFVISAWIVLLMACIWSFTKAAALNVLSHGEVTAHLLGLNVRRLQISLLLIASLSTAAAVAVAGTIGFIGLVVPHALRLVIGNDQRVLLPASVLTGGIALTLADLLARSIAAPVQLPVGVITAFIGVPVFLVLLARSRS
jgi:iron complex transport system permease protein